MKIDMSGSSGPCGSRGSSGSFGAIGNLTTAELEQLCLTFKKLKCTSRAESAEYIRYLRINGYNISKEVENQCLA